MKRKTLATLAIIPFAGLLLFGIGAASYVIIKAVQEDPKVLYAIGIVAGGVGSMFLAVWGLNNLED